MAWDIYKSEVEDSKHQANFGDQHVTFLNGNAASNP